MKFFKLGFQSADLHISHAKSWHILLAVGLGTIMVPINASIVNVSLPTITEFFGANISTSEWVLTSYLIILLSFVLFFGRFGDFWGHERLYLTGLVGFTITSFLCSLSPTISYLIIFRGLQGFAAAMMISVSLGIVKKSFPTSMLGTALGIYAVVIAGGLTMGPVIGGILDGLLGWRSIFLVNIPMGVVSFIICYKTLNWGEAKKIHWDIIGTISQFLALFSLVYFLNYISSNPINKLALLSIIFSLSMLAVFIWWENRTEHPILDLSLFDNISFSAYNMSLHLNYVCMYMVIYVMPFYLLKVLDLSPYTTGLVLSTAPLLIMFLAPVSGVVSDKFGSRPLAFLGALICALAFYSMTQLTFYSTETDVFLTLALLGIGTAIFQSPTNRAIMSQIPDGQAGVASGILVTMRNLGMVFAVCYAGILLSTTISPTTLELSTLIPLDAYNLTTGLTLVATLGAYLSIIMAILTIVGIFTTKRIKRETRRIRKETKMITQEVLDRIQQD